MTQSDRNPSNLPSRHPLSPTKLAARTLLGLIILMLGIYALTRKAEQQQPAPQPPVDASLTPPTSTAPAESTAPTAAATNPLISPGYAHIVLPTPTSPTATPAINISAIAFARDGRLLVAGGGGGAELVDLASGSHQKLALQISGVREMRASPGGDAIAFAAGDASPTIIWLTTPQSARNLQPGATSLAFSADGRILAAGNSAGELRLRNAISWEVTATLRPNVGAIQSIALAPDGRSIAMAGSSAAIWELPGNRPTIKLGGGACSCVAFSPDGHIVATSGEIGVTFWEPVFWQKTATLQTGRPVTQTAFWRSGTTIVMSCADGTIQLWDVTARRRTVMLQAQGPLIGFALSPDDRTLAAASAQGVVLWDTTTRNARPLP